MRFILIVLLLLSAGIIGCAGSPTPIPDPGSEEALLYTRKCSACHSLPHPKRHGYAKWEFMVGVMEGYMKAKEMAPLTHMEKSALLRYLQKHSR